MRANTIIRLTESELQSIILEGVRTILTEDQESKSISAAKKLLKQRLGYSESKADNFVRNVLRHDIPALGIPKCRKFTLGVTRMFVDGEIYNADQIAGLDTSLRTASSEELIDKVDRNLNGWSLTDFIAKMKPYHEEMVRKEREGLSSSSFEGDSEYSIVPINTFDDAKKYAGYNDWCVTTRKDMFDQYTSQGTNQMYFCLRHGFENEKMEAGEGCPLDEYGLSMICVIVKPDGNLAFCTCRWNHENGGNDQVLDVKELSNVLNVNFFEVFKPNDKFRGIIDNAMQKLRRGASVSSCFDRAFNTINGMVRVMLAGKWNVLTSDNEFLTDTWFDLMSSSRSGYFCVELEGKGFNFMDADGRMLSETWFDNAAPFFDNGLAKVKLRDRGWNLITTDGKFVLGEDNWLYEIGGFYNGFARIVVDTKEGQDYTKRLRENYIDESGRILSKAWFDYAYDFTVHGLANVKNDGLVNVIKSDGTLSSDQWFQKFIPAPHKVVYAIAITTDGRYVMIDFNGNVVE